MKYITKFDPDEIQHIINAKITKLERKHYFMTIDFLVARVWDNGFKIGTSGILLIPPRAKFGLSTIFFYGKLYKTPEGTIIEGRFRSSRLRTIFVLLAIIFLLIQIQPGSILNALSWLTVFVLLSAIFKLISYFISRSKNFIPSKEAKQILDFIEKDLECIEWSSKQ